MKRLLGGARMKWASAVTKKWIVSVTGLLLIAASSLVLLTPQAAHADPHDLTNNTPHSVKWLSRFYIVDDLGHNYYDSNTYDGTYEYVEQGDFSGTTNCANHIIFTYSPPTQGGRASQTTNDDQVNITFFYDNQNPSGHSIPNSQWTMTVKTCSVITSAAGQQQQVLSDNKTVTIDNSTSDNRRITFYTNNGGQIVSMYSGVTFSGKGNFKGVSRFFRDDEVTDASNSCPDMIMLHNAQPTGAGRQVFHGDPGDIPGSAMLYAVVKDNSLNGISESYQYVSAPNNISETTCHIKADDINQKRGGQYALAGYDGNGFDGTFQASGLDQNGNTIHGGGKYGDDTFIIFIGTVANMPTDATGAVNSTPANGGNQDKTDQAHCQGGSLGWLICPLVNAILSAVNAMQALIQAFLIVNPLPINSGPIYDSWNNIRNIANILFVIAFFAIIFSQATSIGISNYGIKRLLPRLVLIAIATNLSYFICSFMVDLFNILGVGVANLFAIVNNGSAGTVNVSDLTAGVTAGAIVGVIAWAFASGTIVEIFPLLVGAFLAFLVLILLLLLRQAVLIFLVVLSPLAFVAGLLPGTQNWLNRWFSTFSALLVLYPMLMALFAAANIAGAILSAASGG